MTFSSILKFLYGITVHMQRDLRALFVVKIEKLYHSRTMIIDYYLIQNNIFKSIIVIVSFQSIILMPRYRKRSKFLEPGHLEEHHIYFKEHYC